MKNNSTFSLLRSLSLVGVLSACSISTTHAAMLVITYSDFGSDDLSIVWSGDLNTSGLTKTGDIVYSDQYFSTAGQIINDAGDDIYSFDFEAVAVFPVAAPFSGNPSTVFAPGDNFGFSFNINEIYVPDGFTNGTLLGGAVLDNTRLADLNLNVGTYSWGEVTANSISIITSEAVPEPSSILMLAIGAVSFLSRRKR